MPQSANERKAAERARKRADGLRPVEVWRPEKIPRGVKATIKYMHDEIGDGSDIMLCPEDAKELLEYFGE